MHIIIIRQGHSRLEHLHEQVADPQAVEKVPTASLLLAVVLSQVQPVEDVAVPRLQVDGEGALALAATLVNIPRPAPCVVL